METLKLTIYSDYVCPWCYQGQGAVEKLSQNYPVEVNWMPYYLRPDTPTEGIELMAQLAEQFARGNELQERIRENLKGIGYEF
ncbi:MAG TPA: hypothetical protein DCG78_03410 [Anaerolineaceae bacterium]|jgi:predicted DsbA family dithiol-disulfide isomerase|nr:MAG: Thioredoxin domain-containing protein [Anaerolineae bacterium 49_20]HAE85542.1 hypothetical protein [Anaerolineaceae bacterium]